MPIPTDTFWNIRRLNWVFAVSALGLLLTLFWATFQDYDREWRRTQRESRVWDAALIESHIHREENALTPEDRATLSDLGNQIAQKTAQIEAVTKPIEARIRARESDISNLQVTLNSKKAIVTVSDTLIQDARTAGDTERLNQLIEQRREPAKIVSEESEQLYTFQHDLADAKLKLDDAQTQVTALTKEKAQLEGDVASLWKRVRSLQPKGFLAQTSAKVRAAPLLQFMNPSEKPQQWVLDNVQEDVYFNKIATVDRCATCHTFIDKKDHTKAKVVAFLEAQTAQLTTRAYVYPTADPQKPTPTIPTADAPGASALPEFWFYWGRKLLSPAAVTKAMPVGQVKAISATVGTKIQVSVGGQAVAAGFVFDEKLTGDAAAHRDAIFIAAMQELYRTQPKDVVTTTARNFALALPQRLRAGLMAQLAAESMRQLDERYRYALTEAVNSERAGDALLDASPVYLAHPDLALYADPDSKHPAEAVGCTVCHDGSGEETNFTLAAHTARPVWVDEHTGEPVLAAQLINPPSASHPPTLGDMLGAVYAHDEITPDHAASLQLHMPTTAPAAGDEEVAENAPATAYVDPVSGATGRAVPQYRYWQAKYEAESGTTFESVNELWDWPMRQPQYIQANCVRCHNDVHDIKQTAPVVYEGRALFTKLGCVNCHAVDTIPDDDKRRIGTDLRHVGSKLSAAFINTWVWSPKAFRPSTLMPHFFMAENSSAPEEIRRTRQEARAITEYLVQTSLALPIKNAIPAGLSGTADKGRALFQSIGCEGCHSNLNETGEAWITLDLQKGAGLTRAAAQTKYAAMSYNERQLYAMEKFGAILTQPQQATYADGTPKPVFMHHGPELSGIGDKLTAGGRTSEQARAWLFDWLKEPRHYSDYTIMPQLRLSDQDAADLVEYLLGQHRSNLSPDDSWQATLVTPDEAKLAELTAFQLRSQYSNQVADQKAIDPEEMKQRAIIALSPPPTGGTTAPLTPAEAAARASTMSLEEKQMLFLGSRLIGFYGCMNCHKINGQEGVASPCANLSDWGQKMVEKLDFGYLDPHTVKELPATHGIAMVNGLSVEVDTTVQQALEKKDWDAPLASEVQVAWPEVERTRDSWLVQKLLNPRVWDRGKNLLDPVRQMVNGKCAVDKDGNPILSERGKPYDKTRMPVFYLDHEQVHAIATFVLSNRAHLITPKLLAQVNNTMAQRIAHGRQITERYNCVSCHQVDGNFPQVRQYYPRNDWPTKAPPSLRGEGNKIQNEWLFNFLKNVEPIRPIPQIRMPSFPITDEEATDVAAYFSALSNHEAGDLQKQMEAPLKYLKAQQEIALREVDTAATGREGFDALITYAGGQLAAHDFAGAQKTLERAQTLANASNPPLDEPCVKGLGDSITAVQALQLPDGIPLPGDDWSRQPTLTASARYLRDWALDTGTMREADFAPARTQSELDHNYRTALYQGQFVADLYNSPYPFAEEPRPQISDDRFHKGEHFFYDLQCLKCHVLGDPNAPGANNAPSAPNLGQAYRRLQRRWVSHWVQEPPLVQVNTAMPAFFTGLPVLDLRGQTWPLGQGGSVQQMHDVTQRYGTPTVAEQKDLLFDFLYAAGVKGYTGVQPVTPTPATAK